MTVKVYEAINNVSHELLSGISKDSVNQHQRFNFRGIDAVYNALAPALVKHKLVIIPRMTERESVERATRNGGYLNYVTVRAEFDFISTEDGSKHTAVTYGEAMDSGDKATNKAMSIAYKYAAFQTFCIPTEETSIDPDAEVHDVAFDISPLINEIASANKIDELKSIFGRHWSTNRGERVRAALKGAYDKRLAELSANEAK